MLVYVGNFFYDVIDEDLKIVFVKYGNVKWV